MPYSIEAVEAYPLPVARLFAFFAHPANVVAVAPPGMRLVEAPEPMGVGKTFTVAVRRWGLSRRIVTEVVEWERDARVVEAQRSGPFKSWRLERRFRAVSEAECELAERIEYEPPGGLLGLTLTAARIEAELKAAYQGRRERVLALLVARDSVAGA
ncbi:MAG: hypothetical protein K2W96_11785 [Gemmataceae bacterium]|nr:hypothetical protein [Gemmataceae bacterium]